MSGDMCPVCQHSGSKHWYGTIAGGKLIWRCSDCPGRRCQ